MMGRLFGSFGTLARRLTKVIAAAIVALIAGGSLGAAFDLINVKAFALTGAIFFILLTAWSRSVPRKYKFGIAIPLFLFVLMKLTAFPGLARLEESAGENINIKAFHIAYWLEMPKAIDCMDPFTDPKTDEPVKWYRIDPLTGEFECYDRSGTIKGTDLRPATKDIAYIIARQTLPSSPSPVPAPRLEQPVTTVVALTPASTAVPMVAPTPIPTPAIVPAASVAIASIPEGSISCDSNPEARRNCDRLSR